MHGWHGSLVSRDFVSARLFTRFAGRLGEATRERGRLNLARVWRGVLATLGPASSPRTMHECGARPVLEALGFATGVAPSSEPPVLTVATTRTDRVLVAVGSWRQHAAALEREAVRCAVREGTRWAVCFNGPALRIVDADRPYARRFIEFSLDTTLADERAFALLWALCRAEAVRSRRAPAVPDSRPASLLDEIVDASARHADALVEQVHGAVHFALRALVAALAAQSRTRPGTAVDQVVEHALTIVYRTLFLLFAEARLLLPTWHPVYRRAYSIESLASAAARQGPLTGGWETLQAVWRLMHAGCRWRDLEVTAFNGRLFSPRALPLDRRTLVDEDTVSRVLRALTLAPGAGASGARRIAYADLGVEQLGHIYERVLDDLPVASARSPAHDSTPRKGPRRRRPTESRPTRRARKAGSTFYTPRALTDWLVREALDPLLDGASAERIAGLRVLDPAMGSGGFLVAACRHLAAAYEAALVREGRLPATGASPAERVRLRREIARRCVYGVDVNRRAVQLARLSLWLFTLNAEEPLTFLDHHLRTGDSLIGAAPEDVVLRAPAPGRPHPIRPLPLFEQLGVERCLESAVTERLAMAADEDDTPEAVRRKEARLARLARPSTPLSGLRRVCDLWCASWFDEAGARLSPGLFAALVDAEVRGESSLARHDVAAWRERAADLAARYGFFHWKLEFPEVFHDARGVARPDAGFDVIVGNPPWRVLRHDPARSSPRGDLPRLVRFARRSGLYRGTGDGHPNLYQLFVERAMSLTRPGGRLGLLLPAGLAADRSSGALRQLLLRTCRLDCVLGFENRRAIFPIHRSVRFLLVTASRGAATDRFRICQGRTDLEAIERSGADRRGTPWIDVSRSLLERVSGPSMAIPYFRSADELRLVERIHARFPALSADAGWGASFGRELNATEDRRHLRTTGPGLAVVGGRHLSPYRIDLSRSARIPAETARRLLGGRAAFERHRLAYRDVASPTNQLTLIAAILPPGVVSTHTVFCLRTPLSLDVQQFLCAVLNSYVANHLVRLRVGSHVTAGLVNDLPVPRPPPTSDAFRRIAAGSARIIGRRGPVADASLQGSVARLYGLERTEFSLVLSTFPLVPAARRRAALSAFDRQAV